MNDKIKTAVNVGALILVPLINERHRLKENQDYVAIRNKTIHTAEKAKDVTAGTTQKVISTSRNVKDKTVEASQFVASTAQNLQENLAENRKSKQTKHMSKRLDKDINQRQKEEEKLLKERQKEMKAKLLQADKEAKDKRRTDLAEEQKAERFNHPTLADTVNPFVHVPRVMAAPATETIFDDEYDYDNAPLFEKQREEMAEQIAQRGKF
ncbi:hypothetical protein [Macrococcus carouselicus]|uniref:Uncharacterized protein n=1 Tax=Macrococcus carouselicus TaxID=69969 RepID=A0A9Q8FQ28_9STAP|nr:hypothetical protein [Macrococcus carouselicus]TDM03622.1 hypothetical protein ERX40_00180 [Macrococcus carouselicus]